MGIAYVIRVIHVSKIMHASHSNKAEYLCSIYLDIGSEAIFFDNRLTLFIIPRGRVQLRRRITLCILKLMIVEVTSCFDDSQVPLE